LFLETTTNRMTAKASYAPSSGGSSQQKMMAHGELTLDDIESYTLQLKDDSHNLRASKVMGGSTDGMNGSTDGFMGSTGSLLSDEQSVDGEGADNKRELSYEKLRACLTVPHSGNDGSTNAFIDESDGLNASFDRGDEQPQWDYPGEEMEPYARPGVASVTSASTGRSRTKPHRRKLLVTQHSTRAMVGDDEKDSDYQQLRF
jgi:hypothetical protein